MTTRTSTGTNCEVLTASSPGIGDWVRLRALVRAADGAAGPPVCGVDALGSLAVDPPGSRARDLVATREEQVAGWVRVVVPAAPGSPVVVESLGVHPAHRGRGLGRRLVEQAQQLARASDRPEVRVAVPEQLVPIATSWGATDRGVSRQVFQVLHLPAEGPAAAEPAVPAGVQVARWDAVAPDHLAEGVARLEGHADLAILRALERMRRIRGRTALHAALVVPGTGQVLGYTSISLPASSAQDAEQGMTVVDPDARGHGYGRLLKRLNTAALLRARPWAQRVWTANDEDNRQMATLNESLGFRPWQYRRVLGWSL